MNNTINLNYLTRLSASFAGSSAPRCSTAQGNDFLSMASQIKAEQTAPAKTISETADMSLEEYKQYIWNKISALPMSASTRMQSISIHISEEGFEAMKNDPEDEAWVLDSLAQNFSFQNPWTAICGGGYAVHHFGATKEQYHGEGWYPGYMGGQGAALFKQKSEGSYWEKMMEQHKEYMKFQQEAAEKRQMMMKQRLSKGTVSAAELLMGLL